IHVGQDDMSVKDIRERFPDKIIGLSVSNSQEVEHSPLELVDYIGAGPVFATTTKEDAKTPVGIEWVINLWNRFPVRHIVVIGGSNVDKANSVIEEGADGVSVNSAITKAKNIKEAVHKL